MYSQGLYIHLEIDLIPLIHKCPISTSASQELLLFPTVWTELEFGSQVTTGKHGYLCPAHSTEFFLSPGFLSTAAFQFFWLTNSYNRNLSLGRHSDCHGS